jgi:acyl-CoA synthetase (AMP-forming)/AMP-acid ligase II
MAACIGVPHPKWDERPIVAVVKKPDAQVTREELLQFYEGKTAKWQIPDDVVFVHKTGIRIDEAVRADSGIVYAYGRPYLITVMVQQKDKGVLREEELNKLFESISQEIYSYVANAH